MRLSPLLALTVLFTAGLTGSNAAGGKPPLIPLEHFFARPAMQAPHLSDDGKRVVFLAPVKKRMSVILYDVATEKLEVIAHDPNEDIDWVNWKGDDIVLFSGDIGGNESYMTGAVDLKTRKVTRLAESRKSDFDTVREAALVSLLPRDRDHILILGTSEKFGRNRRAVFENPNMGIYRLNVRTGGRQLLEEWSGKTTGWVADRDGNLRFQSRLEDKTIHLEYRDNPAQPWRILFSHPDTEQPPWTPVTFAADGQSVYTFSETADGSSELRTFHVKTGQRSDPLFVAPRAELGTVLMNPTRDKLVGVTYATDRHHVQWFDQHFGQIAAKLDNTLPDTVNAIIGSSTDESVFLIRAWSDRNPATYYVLDLQAGKLALLGPGLAGIEPEQMRPMVSVTIPARDGLSLPGYLTRPGSTPGAPVPLILLPHGGPYGIRDHWGFDPEVQFFASRGYAVLQVNYRGSGGYGRKHLEAGRGEWGRKMQDDLTDAVTWAIAQNIADPKRVAICGGSYGGYAALAGVTYTPELYRCAVNYVGVSDLRLLTRWSSGETDLSRRFYDGWINLDEKELAARSPVNFVERIRVPTFHAYGENDPRVKIEHWRRLEAQLKKHGKPYESIAAPDEGHGFDREENRFKYYRAMEAFLARHL